MYPVVTDLILIQLTLFMLADRMNSWEPVRVIEGAAITLASRS
jgi:hypothetical protein